MLSGIITLIQGTMDCEVEEGEIGTYLGSPYGDGLGIQLKIDEDLSIFVSHEAREVRVVRGELQRAEVDLRAMQQHFMGVAISATLHAESSEPGENRIEIEFPPPHDHLGTISVYGNGVIRDGTGRVLVTPEQVPIFFLLLPFITDFKRGE